MKKLSVALGLLLMVSGHVFSADTQSSNTQETAPALPEGLTGDESFEPEVTIIEREDETHYEYRVNGQVYMVKIQPAVGPAYYLLDSDGDGTLDVRENDPRNISVPQWILFRW